MAAQRKKKKKKKAQRSALRRAAGIFGIVFSAALVIASAAGDWFVHHPRKWLERNREGARAIIAAPLEWFGYPVGYMTDALGLTGHDAVYSYDEEAPAGSVVFAGAPRRLGPPCPADIRTIDRGDFLIGWSDSLRHPVWCAYHVPAAAKYEAGKRPNFTRDRAVPLAPSSANYDRSGYDRGHMVPNYAIATRFGPDVQKETFLMSNIAPQSPALNRGVWREIEHSIADLWTARWGEIWVIVGAVPSASGETISSTGIDVPEKYYQVVVAQEGLDIRAFAVLYDQNVAWREWPVKGLVTIDELEELTGLDFLPDLPSFIQTPLEAELPSRLWPIRFRDIFTQLAIRFK